MFAKTAFLTGVAGLMLAAAPALAQDAMTPPAAQTPPPASASPAPAQQETLQLQPGSDVKGSDGAVLGKLEGVTTVDGAQHLTVRGTDGALRAVPLGGLKPDGAGVAVGWTSAEFSAAPAISAEPAPAAEPAPPAPAAEPAPTADPSTAAEPTEPQS